jgi:manganese/zinc/iron transport system permease protein
MMIWPGDWSWRLDGWIIVAGVLCAVSASLLGNFLVLRRMSMLGDAISHAVLPGLAAAFLITGSRSSMTMFVGAVVVGVLTALLTQWIRQAGNVDEGASMGVVFTTLFALGLVMIVQAADRVDLDAGCVLYGAIETSPLDLLDVGGWKIPRVVAVLAVVFIVNFGFVVCFFKELKISSFDPALSTALGIPATLMHYLLMTLVAVTAVASFESVGNILVVAMFVVPPSAALMITDRLSRVVWFSALIAASSAFAGHWMASVVPRWFGYSGTSTAGMMAVAAGLLFVVALFFGRHQGLWVRWRRHRALIWRVLSEDVIGFLYRQAERDRAKHWASSEIAAALHGSEHLVGRILRSQIGEGLIEPVQTGYRLSPSGEDRARQIVRSHRLWEQYLASQAEVPVDKIHAQAEQLEHFTSPAMRQQLDEQTASAATDPHGTPIPPESAN